MLSIAISAALVVCAPWPKSALLSPAPYEPPEGCYIGAYIELDPNVRDDIGAFEALVGKKHLSYFRYVGYGKPFPFEWVKNLRDKGYVPHIAWEPNDGLAQVRDDDYLRGWAEAARHADTPIFLRYASEMNGDWQAWSGDPALYIEKWRLVARVMREVAPNVVLVWCPFAMPQRTIPEYYPGDEYVDWVGVNIYSVVRHDGDPSRPGGEDPTALLQYVYDLYADRKPIAICEYAATHFCAATGERTTDFALASMRKLYEALPTRFPRVKMINWFSVDAAHSGLAHNDYALTTDERKLALYRQLIASDYFLGTLVGQPRAPVAIAAAQPGRGAGEEQQGPPLALSAGPTTVSDSIAAGSVREIHLALLGAPPNAVRGRVEIVVQLPEAYAGHMVTVFVDGRVKGISNAPPFSFPVNADALEAGPHKIRVEVCDPYDRPVAEREGEFIVVRSE
jgi:hypothetical protein